MHSDLKQLRSKIRAARKAADGRSRFAWSLSACQFIVQSEAFKSCQKVGAFLAFDGEADPISLMTVAVESNKEVYVPIIVGKAKPLRFARWNPDMKMEANRFGIDEPVVDPAEWIDAQELDFVVTPLVAFDEQCNRIGVGGGFYDRTFAFLNEPENEKKVMLVGLAFELQKLDSIKAESWDVRLDSVATESNLYC